MNKHSLARALVLILIIALGACDAGPKSAKGFRLPDGDAMAGEQNFVALECHACHDIQNYDLPPAPHREGTVRVTLGGTVTKVKTYGELVSSIINPSHKLIGSYPAGEVSSDGESLMKVYNDVMTVQQLVDLVAFLQPRYDVVVPEPYIYGR